MKVNGLLSIDRRQERKPTSSCLIIPSKLWKNTVDCVKTAGCFQYPTTKVVWIRSKDWARNVVSKCGITKPLSWHMSRHSFATSVCLSNGVPIETVSSMLGHKDIKTTQVYAKITKEKLSKDVEKLSQQINNIEEFTFGNVCNDNTNTINGRV